VYVCVFVFVFVCSSQVGNFVRCVVMSAATAGSAQYRMAEVAGVDDTSTTFYNVGNKGQRTNKKLILRIGKAEKVHTNRERVFSVVLHILSVFFVSSCGNSRAWCHICSYVSFCIYTGFCVALCVSCGLVQSFPIDIMSDQKITDFEFSKWKEQMVKSDCPIISREVAQVQHITGRKLHILSSAPINVTDTGVNVDMSID
jgi:hypothetical protein